MGVFRPAARVGRLTLRASAGLDEWPHIRFRAEDRTRLTGSLAHFPGTAVAASLTFGQDGEAEAIRRLGLSPLAVLRESRARRRANPAVRPRGLRAARRPASAQGAQQRRALVFLPGPRGRI